MRLHMISAALPPVIDGIGDYTANLAKTLAPSTQVKILTTQGHTYTAIPGVEIEQVFSVDRPRSVARLVDRIAADRPDWVVLQFDQFSFGRRGWNPWLPHAMASIARRCTSTRFALMAHEDFVPATRWRSAVMRVYQRAQFRALGRAADAIFLSIDPWVQRYAPWFPGKPVVHLPVGSNIPCVPITRAEARTRLGIPESTRVLGLFGTLHASRLLPLVRGAATAACGAGHEALVLYMGPHSAAVRAALPGLPVLAEGPLSPDEISCRFAAIDVYLAPFIDGVSTRRTTFITALQHGIATIGTRGELTDALLQSMDGKAFLLADVHDSVAFDRQVVSLLTDAEARASLGREGRALYEREFAWERIAARLLATLDSTTNPKMPDERPPTTGWP